MCGRFAQYRIPWEYLEPLGLRLDTPMAGFVDPEPVNRYNVAPRSRVRILHQDPGGLRWDLVSWGWEPYWAKGTRPPAINARSETATTSKFFKSIWESGRSIVPADWLNQKLSSHDAKPVVTDEAESVGAFEWHPVGREVGNVRNEVRLDTEDSEKQFILLVNKGREGWNCRSLFGVGLFRAPKSKIFVLQATMRCLRAIGEAQHTGQVFLSNDNLKTLNDELQQNFRISADELQNTGKNKERVQIRVVEPPVKIKLVRVRKLFQVREKQPATGHELMPERGSREKWSELVEKYRLIETRQDGLIAADMALASGSRTFDLTARREKRTFSAMTLVAEVSRYLNRCPLEIELLLDATKEGIGELVALTNEFNELLYDEIIPRLFRLLFELDEYEKKDEYEVDLIKMPPNGFYEMSAAKDKVLRMHDTKLSDEERAKSFHLDTYCFDSGSESWLFWDLLREQRVKKIYFTGMLTHGQSDFFIQYIDPDSRTVRSYYPDFIFQREEPDGSLKYVIVEVKADNQIEDAVVQAKKDFAQQIAVASGMEYRILKSSDADKRQFRVLL